MMGHTDNHSRSESTGSLNRGQRLYDSWRDVHGDDARASGYQSHWSFDRERVQILSVLTGFHGHILDLGCGSGLVTAPLVAKGRQVSGIDINARAVAAARQHGLQAVCGDAFHTPFDSQSFDVVIIAEFIQNIAPERLGELFAETARLLRPGGHLLIIWRNGHSLARLIISTINRSLLALRGQRGFSLWHHAPETVRGIASQVGLQQERMDAIFPPLRWRGAGSGLVGAYMLGTSFMAVFARR